MYRAEVGLAYNDEFVQLYQQAFQAQQTGPGLRLSSSRRRAMRSTAPSGR